jgi:hypothetical protein
MFYSPVTVYEPCKATFVRGAGFELGGDLGEEVAFGSATSPKTNFKAILMPPIFLMISRRDFSHFNLGDFSTILILGDFSHLLIW